MSFAETIYATALNNLITCNSTTGWGGSCAAGPNLRRRIPVGIDAHVSTLCYPDEDKVVVEDYPRYAVTSKSIDVGAGNFLNMRFLHVIDQSNKEMLFTESLVNSLDSGKETLAIFPEKIKDGPPVYMCYWGLLHANMSYGRHTGYGPRGNAIYIGPEDYLKEITNDVKKINNCTLTFMTNRGSDEFVTFIKAVGWDANLVWSTKFNNRRHEGETDYLSFYVIQLKD